LINCQFFIEIAIEIIYYNVPSPKCLEGYPLSKTRGGVYSPTYPPSCARQGTTPPPLLHIPGHGFRWSHDAGPFPSASTRRGVPPTQKYERGYPTPLSKKRGGVYPPPLQKVRGGPPPPLSYERQGTSPPPGAGTLARLRMESRRRGVFVRGGHKGGIPPLLPMSGGDPLPLSKK
jgi:hypothetical protein